MCMSFIDQKVTRTIPRNTQKKNVERQESVNIISGLWTTQESKNSTKKYKFTSHSLFQELFVMPYSEAFVTLTTVKIYVTLRFTAVGSKFHFFFDGYVINFTVLFVVTKNRYMVYLKIWFVLKSWTWSK